MHGSGAEAASGVAKSHALQVIVLGAGGGPQESNTTAFLVRSTAGGWRRGSVVALDAGVHLSAITRILEQTLPAGLCDATSSSSSDDDDDGNNTGSSGRGLSLPYTLTEGPFAGLEVPHASAEANASHIQRTLVDTYLITHPHLDHISGFVVNTAGLPGSRPKRLAGLPSTIAAFKTHIFNNIIWPNLSDENNGAGLVTFMRLVEGGSPALGDGDGRGYVEVTDDLAVKIWSVSHGHCIERHSHRGSSVNLSRIGSIDATNCSAGSAVMSPRTFSQHNTASPFALPPQQSQPQQPPPPPPLSRPQQSDNLVLQTAPGQRSSQNVSNAPPTNEHVCVYDSSAYFLRDITTGREILMFGDVEPDSVSLSPRNAMIWQEAAPKIAAGHLAAIFVECSYDDSQSVDRLYGHLTPRFVLEELTCLAAEVVKARVIFREHQANQPNLEHHSGRHHREREGRKRKRKADAVDGSSAATGATTTAASAAGSSAATSRSRTSHSRHKMEGDTTSNVSALAADEPPVSPRTIKPTARASVSSMASATSTPPTTATNATPHAATPVDDLSLNDTAESTTLNKVPDQPEPGLPPLQGLKIVIIHVKEKLRDGPSAGEVILEQLLEHDAQQPLGCQFLISQPGQSLYF